MPKSQLFKSDFPAGDAFKRDMQVILSFDGEQLAALLSWIQGREEPAAAPGSDEIQIMSARLGRPSREVMSAAQTSVLWAQLLESTEDNAEDVTADLAEFLELDSDDSAKLKLYLERVAALAPGFAEAQKAASYQSMVAPVLRSIEYCAELRAVEKERYDSSKHGRLEDFTHQIESFIPLGMIQLNLHNGERDEPLMFQVTRTSLPRLLDGLKELQLELDLLATYASEFENRAR